MSTTQEEADRTALAFEGTQKNTRDRQRLFISPRTVELHWAKFTKAQIRLAQRSHKRCCRAQTAKRAA